VLRGEWLFATIRKTTTGLKPEKFQAYAALKGRSSTVADLCVLEELLFHVGARWRTLSASCEGLPKIIYELVSSGECGVRQQPGAAPH